MQANNPVWNGVPHPAFREEARRQPGGDQERGPMHSIIYIIGVIVVVLFVLSFLGLA